MRSSAQGQIQSQQGASDRAKPQTMAPRPSPHIQRAVGNQAGLRMLQTSLAIGPSGDEHEKEADRVADQVMRMPEQRVQRACACGPGGGEEEKKTSAEGRQLLQAKRMDPGAGGEATAPAHVGEVLSAPGRPLDAAARAFMEPRFGYDFSQVRVHADDHAAQSAGDIAANAYAVGHHVVFGAGKYQPGTAAGGRLLAHELTHVIQQGAANRPALQRDEKKDAKDKDAKDKDATQQTAPQAADPATANFHVVVRDKGLDQGGGVLVTDLADAKTKLMARRIDKPWTLVLAIHASENKLGAQSPPDWQKNAVFYDDAAVKQLFGGDAAFVAWRDQYGPNRVVLYGCQVTASFEQVIANNLARGGKAPSAGGLGEGCKPLATIRTFAALNQREYDRLGPDDKAKMLKEVQDINSTWGYYGAPPVPNDKVLDYLFSGTKPGSWSTVEVIYKSGADYISGTPPIPYWNRLGNHEYLQNCTKAVGNLRQHTPQAPP